MEKIPGIWVNRVLRSYLIHNRKNLNWIMGIIKKSGLLNYQGMLKEIFDRKRRYNTFLWYQEILEECKKEGLL